uniref:Uncharacterized protein n=1 Tax=Anguilla anguilla TaxID=7936 RepID=A0A0E9XRZ1_ANGAN
MIVSLREYKDFFFNVSIWDLELKSWRVVVSAGFLCLYV